MRKNTIAFILTVAAMLSFNACSKPSENNGPDQIPAQKPVPSQTIRFMDYNVENGFWRDQYNNYDRFVNWISGQAPDVLALCEAGTHKDKDKKTMPKDSPDRYLPSHLPELALRWGHPYTAVGPVQDNYPVAITSRFPIEVVQRIGEGLSHGAIHVKIRGVNYIVIHTWPLSGSKKDRYDKGGDRERYDEIKKVLDLTVLNPKFSKEKYWVMAGDMNSRSRLDDAHYKAEGLVYNYDAMDLMLRTFNGNDIISRFNGGRWVPSVPSGFSRLDYIYTTTNIYTRALRAEIVRDEFTDIASDHYPVMMEFKDVEPSGDQYLSKNICIIPKPESVEAHKGTFSWTDKTVIVPEDEALEGPAKVFAEELLPMLGYVPQVGACNGMKPVVLSLDGALEKEEYILEIRRNAVNLRGGSPQGVFHGLQTLRQVMVPGEIRCMTVRDKPCLAYRGAMLDVSRHYFSVEEIKEFIDILSMHKINVFHWHLTEDQGWRIEIKKYPELTKVGAFRKETIIGRNRDNGVYDGQRYGGFYTQDQVREIVKYAADRFIEVIPEIEMPGHGMGALSSYPWLGCTGGPYEVWTRWGVSKDVYCAGKESTFQFIEDVLTEVLELFPSEYIHIGGDECPKDRWKQCPLCQKRIREEGLKNEYELQSYFIHRVEKWLAAHGRKLIGWDEILEGGISSTATIMAWRDVHNAVKAIWKGNDVILTPKWYCYMDYSQTSDPERLEPLCGTRYLPVEQVYRLDPYDKLKPEYYHHVLGVQGNMWTEYVPDIKSVEYRVLPRLAALSEVGWACDRKDFADFSRRAKALLPGLYRIWGYTYAPYFFAGTDIVNNYGAAD